MAPPDSALDSAPAPVIVLVGAAAWAEPLVARLRAAGYDAVLHADRATYVNWLIDHLAALVVLDSATTPHWRGWLIASTTEQATRRIPVLVVAGDPTVQTDARNAGARLALSAAELNGQLEALVTQHARRPNPAVLDELACQCREPLPPLARLGVEKFNKGAYYAQHDAFEEQWMHESGPVRELYRAILQVGVAYYHITRGNYHGGLKMLSRCVQWFEGLPDVCQGVDVRQLRADAARVRATLLAMSPAEIGAFDRALFRPVRLVDEDGDPAR